MSGVKIEKVKATDDGMRLNRWFLKYYPELTMSHLQKLLRTKQIKIDGKRAESASRVFTGQEIRIPPLNEEQSFFAEHFVSDKDAEYVQSMVIYKDENIIALNKPAGLAVQGGTGIIKHLDGMLDALKFEYDEAPRLVHRIDKETSGILLLARTRKYAEILTDNFRKHLMPKTYLAIAHNVPNPKSGKITIPIEEKKAQTLYSVMDTLGERFSLVRALPLSGRKHQIRIHLHYLGCPIIGDDKYFIEPRAKIADLQNKLYLHAYKIDLHCLYNKKLEITAPLPKHFTEALDLLGLNFKEGK